ncbi:Echinoderm microtubule-associated protein-like [Armadillidium vulgare]|nr:Echinoderm microtubule-associated protein-like [Armadillidium vulgare]
MHVVTVRVCGSPISCLMYNLTGDTLVAGSQNGSMYLFRSSKDGFVYTRYGRMSGFQPISCIDWSESGQYLQTVTSDNDLAYWNLRNLTFIKNHVEVREEIWLTQTCPLSYLVHGIWCASRGTTIHITVDKNENRGLLAAGDTEGYIRLYRYPVLSPKAGWHEYKVYTSYLSCARFSPEEDLLYTTGGTDAAFMRWKLE